MVNLLDILDRCKKGGKVSEAEFDLLLAKEAMRLKNEYRIEYESDIIIPTESELFEDVLNAAISLLCSIGFWCYDTSTIVKVREEEIHEAMKRAPSRIAIGEGNEKKWYLSRKLNDYRKPLICGGPCGGSLSKEYYFNIMSSYAKENVDLIVNGKLHVPSTKGTQAEIEAVRQEVILSRKAIAHVGKPGMCIIGPMSGITSKSLNSAIFPNGMRKNDIHIATLLNELKINFDLLDRLSHLQRINAISKVVQCPILGYVGGPEETAIVSTAEILLDFVLGGLCAGFSPTSLKFSVSTDRRSLWVSSVVLSSIKRKYEVLIESWIWAGSGPCTNTIGYEIAAQTIANTVSGVDMIGSAGCVRAAQIDYYTGMEARIAIEVCEQARRLSVEKANAILKELLKFYEDDLAEGRMSRGKSFIACYSLKDLTPSKEYLEVWENTKNNLKDIGLEL